MTRVESRSPFASFPALCNMVGIAFETFRFPPAEKREKENSAKKLVQTLKRINGNEKGKNERRRNFRRKCEVMWRDFLTLAPFISWKKRKFPFFS